MLALIAVMLFMASAAHSATSQSKQTKYLVWIKDRATPVDLADPRFEYVDTYRTSVMIGAWYDSSNAYMIIALRGTYYHHCRVPKARWDSFRSADSFGRHYNAFIKEKYDCRLGDVPSYDGRKSQ